MTTRALVGLAWLAAVGNAVGAEPPPAPSRGEMLYNLHCIACHSSQMHWRDQRVAKDWPGLVAQVRRWQENAGLGWDDADVVDTARYLNRLHYRYPAPEKP